MGGRIFFGVLALVAIAAIVALCLRPAAVIGVTDKSLAYSLRGAVGSERTGSCRAREDEYVCTALESDRRKPVDYRISIDDYGCWKGRPPGGGGAPGGSAEGCITIVDLVRLGD